MINKVISARSIDELNQKIIEYNKQEWVVKQICVLCDGGLLFALLERQGN